MNNKKIPKEELSLIIENPDWKKIWSIDKAIEVFSELKNHYSEKTKEEINNRKIAIAAIKGVKLRMEEIQSKKDLRSKRHYDRWLKRKKLERHNIVKNKYPESNYWKMTCMEKYRPSYVPCRFNKTTKNLDQWIECPECGTYPIKLKPYKT